MTQHTILLIQDGGERSKKYSHHETVAKAIEEIIKMYEDRLKGLNRTVPKITYESRDLDRYIDDLPDLGALVYSKTQMAYVSKDKEWIKKKVYNHLHKHSE